MQLDRTGRRWRRCSHRHRRACVVESAMDHAREDRWANLSSVIQDTDRQLLDASSAGASFGAPSMYVPRPRPVSPPRAAPRAADPGYDRPGYTSGYGAPRGGESGYGGGHHADQRPVLREHQQRGSLPQRHGAQGYGGAAHGEPVRGDWGGNGHAGAMGARAKENMGPYGSTKPMAVRACFLACSCAAPQPVCPHLEPVGRHRPDLTLMPLVARSGRWLATSQRRMRRLVGTAACGS